MPVRGEQTSNGKQEAGHERRTRQERDAATPFVDKEDGRNRHDEVDDVLIGKEILALSIDVKVNEKLTWMEDDMRLELPERPAIWKTY